MKKFVVCLLVVMLISSVLSACAPAAKEPEARTVIFGMRSDLLPNAYVGEDGKPTGQNYDVMVAVDEQLPQYQFEYEPVDKDTILVGIESGKYVGGLGNYFWNEERAAKYLFPEQNISAGVEGMVLRKEFEGQVSTMEDFAKLGLKPIPFSTNDSNYAFYTKYNEEHPDNQIEFEIAESVSVGEELRYIVEGRYDGTILLRNNYDSLAKELDPEGKLSIFVPIYAIKTWVLYNPNETELVAAIDGAMNKLHEDGTLKEISMKWYEDDVYQYETE